MLYVKHKCNAWDDEKIAELIGSGGKDGLAMYGAWWRVVEIVAAQVTPKNETCSAKYSLTRWSVLMSVRGSHVSHYIGQLAKIGLVTAEWIGSDIRVTIPNLLKIKDEYQRKSGHATDNVPPIEEKELDKEKDTPKPRTKAGPSAECKSLYAAYPRHVAPDNAYRAITKALSKQSFAELLLAVQRFATQCQRDGTEARFIPHPATWFNQGRYNDEPDSFALFAAAPKPKTQYEIDADQQREERREAVRKAAIQ